MGAVTAGLERGCDLRRRRPCLSGDPAPSAGSRPGGGSGPHGASWQAWWHQGQLDAASQPRSGMCFLRPAPPRSVSQGGLRVEGLRQSEPRPGPERGAAGLFLSRQVGPTW